MIVSLCHSYYAKIRNFINPKPGGKNEEQVLLKCRLISPPLCTKTKPFFQHEPDTSHSSNTLCFISTKSFSEFVNKKLTVDPYFYDWFFQNRNPLPLPIALGFH